MIQTPANIPPPPIGSWLRLSEAAERLGVSQDLLRAELSVGRCPVRVTRMGKRGLALLASTDVDALAARMSAGSYR